jgi:DNA-binding SARP family transcriptional activator
MRGTALVRSQRIHLRLIGAFSLWVEGARLHLGRREERLLAFLAMRGRCHRPYVAGSLWPNSDEARALNSLRAAVLRVRRAAPNLLDVDGTTLALRPWVSVDFVDLIDCAERVVHHHSCDAERAQYLLGTGELLPGWYDDWVMFERERLHHLRIRALEVLAVHELDDGNADLALAAAHGAVSLEPLRESARRLMIRAHMALGNRALAAGVLAEYRRDLARDLGVEPSAEIVQEVGSGLGHERSGEIRSPVNRRA